MTKYTAFRCPIDLLPKAEFKAKKDRRSLSNYIALLIERDTIDLVMPVAKKPKAKPAAAKKAPKRTKA